MSGSISRRYKIELLYKNLEHITHANYSAEMAFPYWETLYALIIGQLIIAYFSNRYHPQLWLIPIIGFIFSLSWFLLVIMNHIHSLYRYKNIKNLEEKLEREYKGLKHRSWSMTLDLGFLPEDIPENDRKSWLSFQKIITIIFYCKLTSTWF
jgi:hypothetical protein